MFKRIFISILLLLASLAGYGQRHDSTGNYKDITPFRGGVAAVHLLQIPSDTMGIPGQSKKNTLAFQDDFLYIYNGAAYILLSSGSSSDTGAVTLGQLKDTLVNYTPLFRFMDSLVGIHGWAYSVFQPILGYTAENVLYKAIDFTVLDNFHYPTTSAVNTLLNTTLNGFYGKSQTDINIHDSVMSKVAISDTGIRFQSKYGSDTERANLYAALLQRLKLSDSTGLWVTLTQLKDSLLAHPGAVVSVNAKTGVVVLTTSDIPEGSSLYFTDVRVYNDSSVYLAYVKTLIGRKANYTDTGVIIASKAEVDSAVHNTRVWALATFLRSYTETDPVFIGSTAFYYTPIDSTHYNTAWLNYIVSGSYSGGTLTLTKNNGGTINVSGFGTGGGTMTSITFAAPFTGGTITTTGTVTIPAASNTVDGYLTHGDWINFNNKLSSYTETDPLFSSSTAFYYTPTDSSHYNTASQKWTATGSYSAGTITFTRNDGTTWTVTGIPNTAYGAGYAIVTSSGGTVFNLDTTIGLYFNDTLRTRYLATYNYVAQNYYTKTQSDARYLTSYTETDPIFGASVAKNITAIDTTHYNTAYNKYPTGVSFNTGTGLLTVTLNDGSTLTKNLDGRYLTSFSETDPVFLASIAFYLTATDTTHYNAAYNFYPTAAAFNTGSGVLTITRRDGSTITAALDGRYLTSYTETDPIYSVSIASYLTAVDTTHYNLGYQKYVVSGSYSSGTITYTRNDGTTFTVSGLYTGTTLYYQTVQAATTSQTQRSKLNFNAPFTVTDNSGNNSTDIAMASVVSAGVYGSASVNIIVTVNVFGVITGIATVNPTAAGATTVNVTPPLTGNGSVGSPISANPIPANSFWANTTVGTAVANAGIGYSTVATANTAMIRDGSGYGYSVIPPANDNSAKLAPTAYVDQYKTQVTTTTNATTMTPNTTITDDRSTVKIIITAQAGNITFANPTGTFADGQNIFIQLLDNGVARSISFGALYNPGTTVNGGVLPTVTTAGRTMLMQFTYSNNLSKYLFTGYANGY